MAYYQFSRVGTGKGASAFRGGSPNRTSAVRSAARAGTVRGPATATRTSARSGPTSRQHSPSDVRAGMGSGNMTIRSVWEGTIKRP